MALKVTWSFSGNPIIPKHKSYRPIYNSKESAEEKQTESNQAARTVTPRTNPPLTFSEVSWGLSLGWPLGKLNMDSVLNISTELQFQCVCVRIPRKAWQERENLKYFAEYLSSESNHVHFLSSHLRNWATHASNSTETNCIGVVRTKWQVVFAQYTKCKRRPEWRHSDVTILVTRDRKSMTQAAQSRVTGRICEKIRENKHLYQINLQFVFVFLRSLNVHWISDSLSSEN